MRKEAKQTKRQQVHNVAGYHSGGGGETYIVNGFESPKYFASDRPIKCHLSGFTCVRNDGETMKGFGLETETACNRIDSQRALAEVYHNVIFPNFPHDLFKLQSDVSLNGKSTAEVISQPMTKAFIRNQYKNFKAMYDFYFPAFGITASGETEVFEQSDPYNHPDRYVKRSLDCGCGMHVNVSNGFFGRTPETQEEAIRKLYYIINYHYNFCKALFHRVNSTGYCSRMDYSVAKTMNVHNMPASHGNCFNGSHYDVGRIEIRLVGGQKNFACFRNTMESVFYLCEQVQRISWKDCNDLVKIFSGCNQYVFDRIKSYCYQSGAITLDAVNAIAATVKTEDLI